MCCEKDLVQEHPFFQGLPTAGPMRDIYENVWPTMTLRDVTLQDGPPIKPIAGTVAFDWFSKEHELQYSGPGASWWGSDVVILPYGKGEIVVSQLRLLQQLGKDPVADKLFGNMLKYSIRK